jgi:hypothetical protein
MFKQYFQFNQFSKWLGLIDTYRQVILYGS